MAETPKFKNNISKICWLLFLDAVKNKDSMQFSYYSLFSALQREDVLTKESGEELNLG